jgi:hypothetical protein
MTCEHTWAWVEYHDGRSVRLCRRCGTIRAEMGPRGGEWSWRRNWAFYCCCAAAVAVIVLSEVLPR